ncbi:hypothetical protein B0H17DRAFT_1125592 [Mycena rosella]|uniref:Uncharacterized protein n=1 Tax=Mycena rosella TaxID=1033263 RepID=A0AAD7M9C4_MYCRO|nr:hypothetical protein B0H17DRAFT_1125592 [Mycena rosella]
MSEPPRKRGRPKGSKDGHRPEGAPLRDCPRKNIPDVDTDADNEESDTELGNRSNISLNGATEDFDASFDAFTADDWGAFDQIRLQLMDSVQLREAKKQAQSSTCHCLNTCVRRLSIFSVTPFFTRNSGFNNRDLDAEMDLELDSQSEDDSNVTAMPKDPRKVQPLRPDLPEEGSQPSTTTILHLEEIICSAFVSLRACFPPLPLSFPTRSTLSPSRILVASQFFVNKLCYPNCGKILEIKMVHSRRGGWWTVQTILPWLESEFFGLLTSIPTAGVPSSKSGLSRNILTILRVGNQHKMGPSGVHTLLCENRPLWFSILQVQYLEAAFEQIPGFGDFRDVAGYCGFVPSERYLATMLNRAIEAGEADADQHTLYIEPDQLVVDDSHKVC